MEIYLDNSATTPVLPEVKAAMAAMLDVEYGNPSSLHLKGVRAEDAVALAKKKIAATLGAKDREIIFTSGGTEANNMAVIGAARANKRRGRHLITTCFEHASVYNVMKYMEECGYEVTYLPVDARGLITKEQVLASIRPDTTVISIMMVNNEIGSRLPVEEIAKAVKEVRDDIVFHADAIQGYGKYKIRPARCGIDLMSVSGHKIHGPKGIGFLYKRDGVRLEPIVFGGGQQNGLRSGTLNTPGIVGLGTAAERAYSEFDTNIEKLYSLKEALVNRLNMMDGVTVNGSAPTDGAPQIVSASFAGVRSEVLMHALEEDGIYVSAGAACSSGHPEENRTLCGIGLRDMVASTLRISLSIYNTKEDIDTAADCIEKKLALLRRFTRK